MIKNAVDKTLTIQLNLFKEIIKKNTKLMVILETLDNLGISDYYVGAGAINQTIFNYLHGYEIDYGIGDYDIVYYDEDTSYEAEDKIIKRVSKALKKIDVKLDIKNQARVHLWYSQKFGHDIDICTSVEDSINKWGTTVTCIGVRMQSGKLLVYAPYGLNDLFKMIIRPVKDNYIERDYNRKATKWKEKWPLLTVIPWRDEDEENN